MQTENKKMPVGPKRFDDHELSLLKNTFADNDNLYIALRKVFLEMPISVEENAVVTKLFGKPELQGLMRKFFLPELINNGPLGQNIDLWMTVDIKDKDPEMADLIIQSRELLIEMIETGLKNLTQPVVSEKYTTFKRSKTAKASYVSISARNTYVLHIDQQLMQIRILANEKDETPEQKALKQKQDSTQ